MKLEKKPQSRIFFYIVFSVFGLLLLYLFRPYISILVLGLSFSVVVQPLYKIFNSKFKWPKLVSTSVIVFLIVTLVLIPTIYFFASLLGEINNLLLKYRITNVEDATIEILNMFNTIFETYPLLEEFKIDEVVVVDSVRNFLDSYSNILVNSAFSIGGSTLNFLVRLAVFLILVFYLTPNMTKVEAGLKDLIPLKLEVTQMYIKRFKDFVITFALFWIPIALVQGVLGGLFLLILRVPNALLYTSLLLIFSLIPLIGPGFVMVPLGLYYLANGQPIVGIAILIWYFVVVSNIDNILRTIFVSRRVEMNPIIMFISFIAGIQMFGIIGMLFGPLIVLMFITTLEVYKKYYR